MLKKIDRMKNHCPKKKECLFCVGRSDNETVTVVDKTINYFHFKGKGEKYKI